MEVSSQGNRLLVGWLLWPIITDGKNPMVLVVVRLVAGMVSSCHRCQELLVSVALMTGSFVVPFNHADETW